MESRRIYLIGMMGSGKSHWAGRIGLSLGLQSFDLDRLIEARAGKAIKDIFEQEGEAAFREMEAGLLRTGVPAEEYVLACGGGTPCFYGNMDFMKNNGLVVWLNPSVNELARRLPWSPGTRPILASKSGDDLKNHLKELTQQREKWYSQAHISITDDIPRHSHFLKLVNRYYAEKKP